MERHLLFGPEIKASFFTSSKYKAVFAGQGVDTQGFQQVISISMIDFNGSTGSLLCLGLVVVALD